MNNDYPYIVYNIKINKPNTEDKLVIHYYTLAYLDCGNEINEYATFLQIENKYIYSNGDLTLGYSNEISEDSKQAVLPYLFV